MVWTYCIHNSKRFTKLSLEDKLYDCNRCTIRKNCIDFKKYEELSHQNESYPRKPNQDQTVRNRVINAARNGRCYFCGELLNDLRKNYCNEKCRAKYTTFFFDFTWEGTTQRVLKRDKKCQDCGIKVPLVDFEFYDNNSKLIKTKIFNMDNFQIDHIKAWCLGGDLWDINNLQVLCIECHKKKTASDFAKLAVINRKEKAKLKIKESKLRIKNRKGLLKQFTKKSEV